MSTHHQFGMFDTPDDIEPEAVEDLDPFAVWLFGELPTILQISDDAGELSELMNAGDIVAASTLAGTVGDDYADLYLAVPVTGTPLSDVGNDMLLTCSVAYSSSSDALATIDVDAMNAAAPMLTECSTLLSEATLLLPGQ